MESAMILLALTISFLYFSLAASSSGSGTFYFMNFPRSFSSRMSPILYFQEQNFSTPSNLSTSLVLVDILTQIWENEQKMKVLRK
jgi:hypothetical protein